MLWAAYCTAFLGWGSSHPSRWTAGLPDTVCWCKRCGRQCAQPLHNKIHLRTSKTDQYGQGVNIYLGRTGSDLCPVSALLAYLAARGNEPGPLFKLRDGRFLTKDLFITRVRSALSVLGYDKSSYAGHSFRIGAATTAAERGIEDSVIKMLGRWESSAYQLYVRASQQVLSSISRRLVMSD